MLNYEFEHGIISGEEIYTMLIHIEKRIRDVAKRMGLDLSGFTLTVKCYSKTFWGRYDPNTRNVRVYILTESGEVRPFEELYKTFLHEYVHYEQTSHPDFKRVRGIMHNVEFKKRYAELVKQYEEM
jgi:hypothetical protein